jgi:hypothetical protein
MAKLSKPALARLAFWSANMIAVRESRWSWPGFSYEPREWKQMERFAKMVGGGAYFIFIWLNALLFVVFAGIAIVGFFLPVMIALYPEPSQTEALPFVLVLALTALLAIGVGLPLSMKITAWFCANDKLRAKLISSAPAEALAAKVSWQLTRMTLIMCGLLVPCVLLAIAFNVQSGPWLTALKIVCGVAIMGSAAFAALRGKSS